MLQTSTTPPLLSPAEADALLSKVNSELAQESFDDQDTQQLQNMIEGLGDTRGMMRLGFAEALGKVGKPAVPLLIEALGNHGNVVVRRAAAKTLTLIGDPTAVPNLIHALLHDEDTVVKGSSVGALARTGEASVPPLLEILRSPDSPESTKGHSAWALAFIGAKAKEQLYAAYDSDSPQVRSAIVGAIAKVAEENREERAFKLLVDSLQDSAAEVRSEAAAALGNLTYQPAVPILIELLNHEVGETRKAAGLALMKIKDTSAIEHLEAALARESIESIQKSFVLAISLLKRESEADDDDWD